MVSLGERDFSQDSLSPLTDVTVQSSRDSANNDEIDSDESSSDEEDEIDYANLKPEYDLSRGNYKESRKSGAHTL